MKDNKFLTSVICAIVCFFLFVLPLWIALNDDMNIMRFLFILFLCLVDLLPVIFCNCDGK